MFDDQPGENWVGSKKMKQIRPSLFASPTGVKTEKIDKGRIFVGVQEYLEGILGDPSHTNISGKNKEKHRTNQEKPEKS